MQIEIVDLDRFPNSPSSRYGHSSTLLGSILYVFGGADADPKLGRLSHTGKFFTTMHRFDTEVMEWLLTVHEDEISGAGRHYHTCVLNPDNGCLYIFGGKANGYRNDIVHYNPVTGIFEPFEYANSENVPSPRWGHSSIIRPRPPGTAATSMLVFGGYDSNGFVHNTLHEFFFQTREWRRLDVDIEGMRKVPRRYLHSAALVRSTTLAERREMDEESESESESESEKSESQDEKTGGWHYLIVRGLQKNKQALDDVWSLDISADGSRLAIRPVKMELAASRRGGRIATSMKTYGQRAFVLQNKVYLYGGRSVGDDVEQCLLLHLREETGRRGIRRLTGIVKQVPFPFSNPPLAYGSVTVIEEEPEAEEGEGRHAVISKVLFFGGQRTDRRLVQEALRPMFPQVFSNRTANLLHFCPNDALMIILEFLDRVTLCSIRAVSSRWSPSLLSSHDHLWEKFYYQAHLESRYKWRRDEIESCLTMKSMCQAVFRIDAEERARSFLEREVGYFDVVSKKQWGVLDECLHQMSESSTHFKCVVVGTGGVGKTSLLITFHTDSFPVDYVPTVFDNYTSTFLYQDHSVALDLWDTGYSVVNRASFDEISCTWVPEVREHLPEAAIVLVGTKADLRDDPRTLRMLHDADSSPVSPQEAERLSRRLSVQACVETSALKYEGIRECFNLVALMGVLKNCARDFVGASKKRCGLM